jgi:alpha-1,6-mannosyltransferase
MALGYGAIAYISLHKTDTSLLHFLLISGAAFLVLLIAYRKFNFNQQAVFWWAALFHAIGLFGLPLFEDDHYRYLWDGYRTVVDGSPYGIAPDQFFSDRNVPTAMQNVLSGINNPEVPTIYGPALQAVYAIAYLIAPAKLWPIKVILILANLVLIFLLLKHASAKQVMLYAWNPLVFKEVALTSHPDALLGLIVFIAWLTRKHWYGRVSGIIFGIALAVKISALPALAWLFWKRQFSSIVIAIAIFLACYIPFIGAGSDWQGFKIFAQNWEFNAGPYAIANALFATSHAKTLCAALAFIGMMWVMRGKNAAENPPWHRLFGILLLLSPVINAWYLLWFLPLAVLHSDRWPWWASAAVLLSYVTGQNLGDETLSAYEIPLFIRVIEWGLIGFIVTLDLVKPTPAHLFAPNSPLSNNSTHRI